MPLYLTLSRGPRADLATPVLASSDPRVVDAALEAIRRLGQAGDDEAAVTLPSEGRWRVVGREADSPEADPR